MKAALLVVCLLLASGWQSSAFADDRTEYCTKLGKMAEGIMLLRQKGGILSDVLDVAKSDDGSEDPLIRTIVLHAFDEPRFSADKNRQQASIDYRNEVELACFSDKSTSQ